MSGYSSPVLGMIGIFKLVHVWPLISVESARPSHPIHLSPRFVACADRGRPVHTFWFFLVSAGQGRTGVCFWSGGSFVVNHPLFLYLSLSLSRGQWWGLGSACDVSKLGGSSLLIFLLVGSCAGVAFSCYFMLLFAVVLDLYWLRFAS